MSDDELLASLSHQVRTPLSVIRGYAELLEARDDETTRREAAGQIRAAAEVLSSMVDDLVIVLGLESGLVRVEREPVSLVAAAGEAMELVRPKAPEHSFTTAWDDGDPLVARADSEHLSQIFTGLLLNACRLSPGGGAITITGGVEGDLLAVGVSDQGPGLEEDELAAAYERRVSQTANDRAELRSTGLELYKVKGLVELQGGTVTAESKPGAGSTFSFTLPRAADGEGV